jgi:hypothetical protein
MTLTWETRDPETGRHQRNGHTLVLQETDWKCLQCQHYFDAATDADKFFCGEPCRH